MVPVSGSECPFMFEEVTSDFQTVSIQGQATYRIIDPRKVSSVLNFTMYEKGGTNFYLSQDAQHMSLRVSNIIRVMTKKHIEGLKLSDAIRSSEILANKILEDIRNKVIRFYT
jgi:hypothetical protein